MKAYASLLGLLLVGCSAPPLHLFESRDQAGPTMAQLVDHFECSLDRAMEHELSAVPQFDWTKYVAALNLTVEATHVEGLDPSLSFVNPYKVAGTNITLAVGAELNGTQHRTFTYAFPIYLSSLHDFIVKNKVPCGSAGNDPDGSGNMLEGTGKDGPCTYFIKAKRCFCHAIASNSV